jgi:UDPglucose 6-dehydrogenase
MKKMDICVIGAGYVGLSNAVLLAQKHYVTLIDIDESRIKMIKQGQSPIHDVDLQNALDKRNLLLNPTAKWSDVRNNCDFFVIATPTDYDPQTNYFNTKSVDSVIAQVVELSDQAIIVVKSTLPIGYTDHLNNIYPKATIMFAPEFLREGQAFKDNLYPSRIILGTSNDSMYFIAEVWKDLSLAPEVPILLASPAEAEAIKLFANSYLALRVAFFNELDTFAEYQGLRSNVLIEGIGLDSRIGNFYNNPSFGYGGYCFPKDTKQLLANFEGIPQRLIQATVESNIVRKRFIVKSILKRNVRVIGIYRLVMKNGSDNYRESAVLEIIDLLAEEGIEILVYEPYLTSSIDKTSVIVNLNLFKHKSDLIIANRWSEELNDVRDKVYTRDLFMRD